MKLVYIILPLLWLISGCREQQKAKEFERPVRIFTVKPLEGVTKSFAGIFTSALTTTLAFRNGGDVNKMAVSSGDIVEKGQFIASISPTIFQGEEEAAKAQLLMAESDLERYKNLLNINAVSIQQSEAAYASFMAAKSRYNNAATSLEETKIYAPFSGVVEERYVDNFERVQGGQKVVRIIKPDSLEVEFTVAPSDLKLLTLATVRYTIRSENTPPRTINGKLKSFVDVLKGSEGYDVVLSIDQRDFNAKEYNIRAGNSCKVLMEVENPYKERLFGIPISAIYTSKRDNDRWVWIYSDSLQRVNLQKVELGELYGKDMVVVRSGLSEGDKIVSAGIYFLSENQRVKAEKYIKSDNYDKVFDRE